MCAVKFDRSVCAPVPYAADDSKCSRHAVSSDGIFKSTDAPAGFPTHRTFPENPFPLPRERQPEGHLFRLLLTQNMIIIY
jgi:hypothetical protein